VQQILHVEAEITFQFCASDPTRRSRDNISEHFTKLNCYSFKFAMNASRNTTLALGRPTAERLGEWLVLLRMSFRKPAVLNFV
jgi:hypothetical protein